MTATICDENSTARNSNNTAKEADSTKNKPGLEGNLALKRCKGLAGRVGRS